MADKKKKDSGRSEVVDKVLKAFGTGSDMAVAGALKSIPASALVRAINKSRGKETVGKTRTGRALSELGVSDNFVETMEGTRKGRKAPLDYLQGFSSGGQVKKAAKKKFKGSF